MMDQPEYFQDDDAMIDDYLEDFDEPPPFFPEDEEIFFEDEKTPVKGVKESGLFPITKNLDTAHSASVETANLQLNDVMKEDDGIIPPPPANYITMLTKTTTKKMDPFCFQRQVAHITEGWMSGLLPCQSHGSISYTRRYEETSRWREENKQSPTTMRAKAWKSRLEPLSSLALMKLKEVTPYAPDSELLFFQQKSATSPKRKQKVVMPFAPIPGTKCLPFTLGDGTRVFCPANQSTQDKSTTIAHDRFDAPLGVSMNVLLLRVQTARRRKEHEQQQHKRQRLRDMEQDLVRSSSPKIKDTQLWVDKHAPTSFVHLLSDERSNREVVRALRQWDPYVFHREPPKRPETFQHFHERKKASDVKKKNTNDKRPDEISRVILLSGSPGVGKTTLAHVIARHVGYRPIEVNGSDERTESTLMDRIVRAMDSSTINFSGSNVEQCPNCLIVDEIDGANAARTIQSLVNIIRAEIPAKGAKKVTYLRRPIIFICNNKFAPALKPLLPYAKQFNVNPPSESCLVTRLRTVLAAENVSCGSSTLLNELVTVTGGDIRSCLYTLQFASAKAFNVVGHDMQKVDIGNALKSALRGDGLKDECNDVAGTVSTIFRKEKHIRNGVERSSRITRSVEKVLDAVRIFNDNSKILDCLFLNVLRVSFIDPTFDRCAAAHEWLSSSDIYRSHDTTEHYAMEALHIPSTAAAIHLLCCVEQRQELTFSTREFAESRFHLEAKTSLAHKFAEGLSLQSRCARGVDQLATETIPYALWILSAGQGSGALDRVATSVNLLSKGEQESFHHHAAALQSLGLSYVAEQEEVENGDNTFKSQSLRVRLEPPIEIFVNYSELQNFRQAIPPVVRYEQPLDIFSSLDT